MSTTRTRPSTASVGSGSCRGSRPCGHSTPTFLTLASRYGALPSMSHRPSWIGEGSTPLTRHRGQRRERHDRQDRHDQQVRGARLPRERRHRGLTPLEQDRQQPHRSRWTRRPTRSSGSPFGPTRRSTPSVTRSSTRRRRSASAGPFRSALSRGTPPTPNGHSSETSTGLRGRMSSKNEPRPTGAPN